MKLITIALFFLSLNLFAQYDQQDYQDYFPVKCLKEINNKYQLPRAITFDISACATEDLDTEIQNFLILRMQYQFEWYNRSRSSINEAIELLETDHTGADGSPAFSSEEIEIIIDFYTKPNLVGNEIEVIEFANSYYSGTGISRFAVFYIANQKEMVLIEKFVYAE